jgi:hypothetical protein
VQLSLLSEAHSCSMTPIFPTTHLHLRHGQSLPI